MNNAKIFAGALLVSVLAVVLNGCGGGGGGDGDTLEKVKKAGVIKWGADNSGGAPFVFGDPNDPKKIVGFEVDMMEKIAGHMGVKQEQVQAQWSSLLEALADHRSDIVINGIEINEINKNKVNFSKPYFTYEQQLSVRAEDKEKYKSLDDLKGKTICILSGTESGNVLLKAGFTKEQIVPREDSNTPYSDLKLKRFEAVLAEWEIADYYAGKDKEIYNLPKTFAPGDYGVAVRKEKASDTLLAEIDKVLTTMKENGELAAIYKKWNIWNDAQKKLGIVEK